MPIDTLTTRHWNTNFGPPVDSPPVAATLLLAAQGATTRVAPQGAASSVGLVGQNAAVQIVTPGIHGQDITTSVVGRSGAFAAGVPNYSGTLTTVNGTQTFNVTQTVRNQRFTGKVICTGGTITFEFCTFEFAPPAAASAVYQYDGGADAGIVVMNWCEIDSGLRGNTGNFETCGFQAGERGNNPATTGSRFQLYRCRIAGYGNAVGIHQWRSAATSALLECYIGPVTRGNANHPDGIECYSSGNILIGECRFELADGDQSNVNITTDFGDLPSGDPVTVRNCWVGYATSPFLCRWFNQGGGTYVKNVSFIGNRCGDQGHWGRLCDFNSMNVTYNAAYAAANPDVIYWAIDNVWSPNGEAVTGGTAPSGDVKAGLPHVNGAFITAANFYGGEVFTWNGSVVGPPPGMNATVAAVGVGARDAVIPNAKHAIGAVAATLGLTARNAAASTSGGGSSVGPYLPFYLDATTAPRRAGGTMNAPTGNLLYTDANGNAQSVALTPMTRAGQPSGGPGWHWNGVPAQGTWIIVDGDAHIDAMELNDVQINVMTGGSLLLTRCHSYNLWGQNQYCLKTGGGPEVPQAIRVEDCLFHGGQSQAEGTAQSGGGAIVVTACATPMIVLRTHIHRHELGIGFQGVGMAGIVQDCYMHDMGDTGTGGHFQQINITGDTAFGTHILHNHIQGPTGQTGTIDAFHDHGCVSNMRVDANLLTGFPQYVIYDGAGGGNFPTWFLRTSPPCYFTNNRIAKAGGQNSSLGYWGSGPTKPPWVISGNVVHETGVSLDSALGG